jgi:hypothetical protein
MRITSIDVGLKTISLSQENYNMKSFKPLKKNEKYELNGVASQVMNDMINKISMCGDVEYLDKQDLGSKLDYFAGRSFHSLYSWLKVLDEDGVWSKSDIILIEQQMLVNRIASTLMNHLHAWLLIHYPSKNIILYPSKNKTRILGMSLKCEHKVSKKIVRVTKYQRKKWSIDQMKVFLTNRKDDWSLNYIFVENKNKKDDLCDTLLQSLSYIVSLY